MACSNVSLRCTQLKPASSGVPGVPSQQIPFSVDITTHAPCGPGTLLQWSVLTPGNATTIIHSFHALLRHRCLSNLTQRGDGCKHFWKAGYCTTIIVAFIKG